MFSVESTAMREIDETRPEEIRQWPLPMEDVERLVDLVRESGVGEIRVRQGEVEITVKARPEAPAVGRLPVAGPSSGPSTGRRRRARMLTSRWGTGSGRARRCASSKL